MTHSMFPVALLSGGLATRLRPLTTKIPKSMVDVNGVPFIEHQLKLLNTNGVERVVICVGYLGEMIESFVGDGSRFGLQVTISYDGDQLLGTAGAIKRALPLLGDAFFVLYGDSYLPCDFKAIQLAFEKSEKEALMTVFHNNNLFDKSNVEFKDGKIIAYGKENGSYQRQYIDYGLGIFNASVFDGVPSNKVHDLALVYKSVLEKKGLAAFEVPDRFYEIGSPQGLEETKNFLKGRK